MSGLLFWREIGDENGDEIGERLDHAQPPPIIFITGHGNIPMGVSAMKAGAMDFLPKPVDADTLP